MLIPKNPLHLSAQQSNKEMVPQLFYSSCLIEQKLTGTAQQLIGSLVSCSMALGAENNLQWNSCTISMAKISKMASDTEGFSFDSAEALQRNIIGIARKILELSWRLIEALNSQVAHKKLTEKSVHVSVLPKNLKKNKTRGITGRSWESRNTHICWFCFLL